MRRTPLEDGIAQIIMGKAPAKLTERHIRDYQLRRLRHTIDYVTESSPFYKKRLTGFSSKDLADIDDLARFPFTTPHDLSEMGTQFLCVSQSEIERVTTLMIPGTAGQPRRVHFTGEDLELTIDFFRVGMSAIVEPGQKVLILMPGERAGSVGDLLARALGRLGVEGFVHGIVEDPSRTISEIVLRKIDCLVGIPIQVLSIARHQLAEEIPAGRIKSVLLSADYVPQTIVDELQRTWDCPVFNHYGTTEMGFGGGVECQALSGYHLREADLFFEIVDPVSGCVKSPGELGEIVFTTLTRKGMPLVRYRTGDLARFLAEPCPCGSMLRRMEKVRGRLHEMVMLSTGDWLSIADFDEKILGIAGILDYTVAFSSESEADRLDIRFCVTPESFVDSDKVTRAVLGIPAVGQAIRDGFLTIGTVDSGPVGSLSTGEAKRAIVRHYK